MTTVAPARVWPTAWLLPFGVTLLAMFALQLSNLGFSPLLPSIQREFDMSYTQLGTFTGMYGLLAMVLSVPAGVSAKRFGERRVLGLGLLGVAAGSLLLGEAWSVESAARAWYRKAGEAGMTAALREQIGLPTSAAESA